MALFCVDPSLYQYSGVSIDAPTKKRKDIYIYMYWLGVEEKRIKGEIGVGEGDLVTQFPFQVLLKKKANLQLVNQRSK